MKRIREFRVAALSIAMLSAAQWWCVNPAQAQKEPTARRIAVILVGQSQQGSAAQAFRQGLRDAGYTEGHDVVLEWRSAQGNYGQVPAMVADIVRTEPDVIVVESTVAMAAVKEATSRIPIVMAVVADPVGSGFVQSLARPGGNVTGLSVMMSDILTKRLQLLKEAMPGLKRLAVLRDPAIAWHSGAFEALAVAAKPMGVELTLVATGGQGEFEPAFSASRKTHAQAVFLLDNAFFFAQRATILRLAAESNLPVATGGASEWVEDGAFLSYSADFTDMYRRAARYVDSILKGANPKDLPIQQPTKFLFKVNLKIAKALGLRVPDSTLVQADKVIR